MIEFAIGVLFFGFMIGVYLVIDLMQAREELKQIEAETKMINLKQRNQVEVKKAKFRGKL